jgi:protein tyrosine phosphatase (PTP) superfamily phosphohydrolase (DUF442 family)
MPEQPSINLNIGRDMSGVFNAGTISGSVTNTVTNTISQLPDSTDPNQPNLKELLAQLQAAIEAATELPEAHKTLALAQVETLAEAGLKPEDTAMQKAGKTAMTTLEVIKAGLVQTTDLAKAFATFLPAIVPLLAFL